MGFKAPRTIYKLVFTEPEYEGLTVRARSASTEEFLAITDLSDNAEENGGAAIRNLLETFATVLVSWNIDDDRTGQQLVPDFDGLKTLEFAFVMKIVNAWIEAVGDVPAPLESGSTPGESALMASMPMEVLHGSLVN
jgi:hypothetical protein